MSRHDELVENTERKVVDTFYERQIVPKVKLQKIVQRVSSVTGVWKLMCGCAKGVLQKVK